MEHTIEAALCNLCGCPYLHRIMTCDGPLLAAARRQAQKKAAAHDGRQQEDKARTVLYVACEWYHPTPARLAALPLDIRRVAGAPRSGRGWLIRIVKCSSLQVSLNYSKNPVAGRYPSCVRFAFDRGT
jgi:hypothetical protein